MKKNILNKTNLKNKTNSNLISQIEILEILLNETFQIFNLNYQNVLTVNLWDLLQQNLINLIKISEIFNEEYNSSLENLFNKFSQKIFELIFSYSKNKIYLENLKNILNFFNFIFTLNNSKWKFLIIFYKNFRKNFLNFFIFDEKK